MERNSWGFSLFVDDIRSEMGGKLSAMGIYQADMIFPTTQDFPLALPRFGILVKYYEVQNFFKDDIFIRVFFPGDSKDEPGTVVPFNRAALDARTLPPSYELEEDQERIFNLTFPIFISPLLIKQEGFVKVRAVCGGTTTNLGSLMIRKARPDENLQLATLPTPPVAPG
ncbi:MAG TPA: hypothetical protein VGF53_10920 [Pseudolabrys sp.]